MTHEQNAGKNYNMKMGGERKCGEVLIFGNDNKSKLNS
jgi:hypothetical protein